MTEKANKRITIERSREREERESARDRNIKT
jgi:hypothetical protein